MTGAIGGGGLFRHGTALRFACQPEIYDFDHGGSILFQYELEKPALSILFYDDGLHHGRVLGIELLSRCCGGLARMNALKQ